MMALNGNIVIIFLGMQGYGDGQHGVGHGNITTFMYEDMASG